MSERTEHAEPDPAVEIRRAGLGDAAAAAELMIAARRAAVPAIPAPVHPDDETRRWFTEHVMVDQDVWVATAGATIEAVLVLTPGWIEHLYVDPARTGGGIGSRLIEKAKARSTGELLLWTFESNVGAQRFYERHGFVEIDRTDGDNEEGAPDIKYRWRNPEPGAPDPTTHERRRHP